MPAEPWVCRKCRSVNQPRASRCYSCNTPQALAQADLDQLVVAGAGSRDTGGEAPVGEYRSSDDRAFLAQVLIVVALLALVAGEVFGADLVGRVVDGAPVADERSTTTVLLGIGGMVAGGAAILAWAAWLSRVVENIPALGLGWPRATPRVAIFESLVPVVNLYRVPSILRDVMNRLEPGAQADALIAAAWFPLVGGVVVPRLARTASRVVFDAPEAFDDLFVLVNRIALGFTIAGGIILIGLIQWIENRASRRAQALQPTPTPG